MKTIKLLIITTLAALIIACGKSSDTAGTDFQEPTSDHDGTYRIVLYNDVGECVRERSTLAIKVVNGVIVDSAYRNTPITGIVSGDKLEAFIDAGNGQTIDIAGVYAENSLTGTWKDEVAGCYGYFEQYSGN